MATPYSYDQNNIYTNIAVALSAVFMEEMLMQDDVVGLYNIEDSESAVERNQAAGGFGKFRKYDGAINYQSTEPLYRADYEHDEFAEGFAIPRKLIDDDEYGQMSGQARALGEALDYTVIDEMVSVFNNAFSSSYLGPDEVALCSDSHPYSPTNSDTQDNKRTTALTHDAVVTDRKDMLLFENSRGLKSPAILDTILVHPDNMEEAKVIVESQNKSGTANNDTNTTRNIRALTSPLLTDSNNWFSIDSRKARRLLRWYWRVRPEFGMDPSSDFNLAMKVRAYARWSYGWDDWRWVIGHEVA